jgi:murein DD-endopeptidase MepM/ murein hydrolase activator NlpD
MQPAVAAAPPLTGAPTDEPAELDWKSIPSSIGREAKTLGREAGQGATKIVGVARKGTQELIGFTGISSDKCKYPYTVCAQPGQISNCGFCWPAYGTVSRGFKIGHKGLDILVPTGTPVYAAKSGTVLYAGNKLSGFGNVVIIDHGGGVATVYGHNSRFLVKSGDCVTCGQQIACAGQTGRATAPHCHFEIRQGGRALDPKPMLP